MCQELASAPRRYKITLRISHIVKNLLKNGIRSRNTCCLKCSPKVATGTSEKQSILEATLHLFAKKRDIRPLFLREARPINDE